MVNGQTAEKEPVTVLTHGHSCDYRVYGSDTPLLIGWLTVWLLYGLSNLLVDRLIGDGS